MVMSGGGQHPGRRGAGTVDNMRMVWMVHMTVPESLRNHLKLWRFDEDLGGGRKFLRWTYLRGRHNLCGCALRRRRRRGGDDGGWLGGNHRGGCSSRSAVSEIRARRRCGHHAIRLNTSGI